MKPIKVGRDLIAPQSIFSITDVLPAELYEKASTGKLRVEVQTSIGSYPLDLDHAEHVALVKAWTAAIASPMHVRIESAVVVTTSGDDYLLVRTESSS